MEKKEIQGCKVTTTDIYFMMKKLLLRNSSETVACTACCVVTSFIPLMNKNKWKMLEEAECRRPLPCYYKDFLNCGSISKCENLVNFEHRQHFLVLLHCFPIKLLIYFQKMNLNHTFKSSDGLSKFYRKKEMVKHLILLLLIIMSLSWGTNKTPVFFFVNLQLSKKILRCQV